MLIVATRTTLRGIDKNSGEIIWKVENNWFGNGELLTPIIANGQLIYGIKNSSRGDEISKSGRIVAFADPLTGSILKQYTMPGRLGGKPLLHKECLYIKDYQYHSRTVSDKLESINELRLNCLNLNSGKLTWTFQGNGVPAASEISVSDGMIFDVFANVIYAFDEDSGNTIWQSRELDAAARNPNVIDELGVIVAEIPVREEVVLLDASTGLLRPEILTGVISRPLIIGREIIYGTRNEIVLFDISTGKETWSIPVGSGYQYALDD